MVWTKLDDRFWSNPKIAGVSDTAFRLYVSALNWSTANLTDGYVDDHMLRYFVDDSKARTAAQELQKARLWHQVPDGWQINAYDEFQPSKAEWEYRSKSFAERGAKGNHVRWHKETFHEDCKFCVEGRISDELAIASRSRPDPTRPEEARAIANPISHRNSESFQRYNSDRAIKVAKQRKANNPGGYAQTLEKSEDFVTESVRLYLLQEAHRDCDNCGGTGQTTTYSPGAGSVLIDCDKGGQ